MCELVKYIQDMMSSRKIDGKALEEIQTAVADFIPSFQAELCEQDWEPGRYMLYKDPTHGFVIMMLVWGKGDKTPIHAHGTWGVEAVIKNQVCVTNYSNCPSNPKETCCAILSAGEVTYVIPPDEDVHVVEQSGDLPAITIHVYGKELTENIVFSPGSGYGTRPVTCKKVKTKLFNFNHWSSYPVSSAIDAAL